jgi:hypothetical protein
VESPDNFLEIIKGRRGPPSVDSPGKLCKIKDFEERFTEKCRLWGELTQCSSTAVPKCYRELCTCPNPKASEY